MPKISIYLDEEGLKDLENLVKSNPHLTKRNRSELISYLLKQAAKEQKRMEMLEAANALDELNIGWSEEEQNCAIIDAEVSG
jgi:metal-responsive CopG/Arc/MetJ family transcriptional regulator